MLAAMWRYGSDWFWPDGEHTPLELIDANTGKVVNPQVVDENTSEPMHVRAIRLRSRKRARNTTE